LSSGVNTGSITSTTGSTTGVGGTGVADAIPTVAEAATIAIAVINRDLFLIRCNIVSSLIQ
jgi:hypothetical protein